MQNKMKKLFFGGIVLIVIFIIGAVLLCLGRDEMAKDYKAYGFANMRGEGGKVYAGIGGAYGEELPVKASTFAVREGQIYYVSQIKEDYVVQEERTSQIWVADLDGSNPRMLVEDGYNLGFGQEKLIGDKLFYPTGVDEEYNFIYGWYDLNTQDRGTISTGRINNILGYDGTYLYYGGYHAKKSKNIVGKYHLTKKKDKILFSYPDPGELGGISNLYYYKGTIYALTLVKEAENYDERTAVYHLEKRKATTGKREGAVSFEFTGSANYGFLFEESQVYFFGGDAIMHLSLSQEEEKSVETQAKEGDVEILTQLRGNEYWGIPHFAPGDGYLYYEAIADIDEETGNNDYFYRVKISGGEPELLAQWFVS